MFRYLRSSSILISTVLLIAVAAAMGQGGSDSTSAGKADSKSLDILYTGRLLGYYRLPDKQRKVSTEGFSSDRPWCFDARDPRTQMSTPARRLSDTLHAQRYQELGNRVLVGTGDNFALELSARVFDETPTVHQENGEPKTVKQEPEKGKPRISEYSKDQFSWDWSEKAPGVPIGWVLDGKDQPAQKAITRQGFQVIPTDNVACFLAYAGYDAIVPGRHDFYYGPERVRSLARLLASIDDSSFHSVQMLADNLLIKDSWISGHTAIPDSQRPLLPFEVANDTSSAGVKVNFPEDQSEVLPWLSRFDLSIKTENPQPSYAVVLLGPRPDPDREDLSVVKSSGRQLSQLQLDANEECWFSARALDLNIQGMDQCIRRFQNRRKAVVSQNNAELDCGKKGNPVSGGETFPIECHLHPVKPLQPGYYKLCYWRELAGGASHSPQAEDRPQCSRFTVAVPFLQYPDRFAGAKQYNPATQYASGPKLLLQGYETPQPYLVKKVCPRDTNGACIGKALNVAVFGIVDPDLPQQVGEINSSWLAENDPHSLTGKGSTDKEHKMSIKTADAAKALKQLLDYWQDCKSLNQGDDLKFCYDETGRKDEEVCKTPSADNRQYCNDPDYKILLAQMSPEKASQITAQLKNRDHFDVVITDHDPEHFTRDQITILDPTIYPGNHPDPSTDCDMKSDPAESTHHCHVPTFVVVPPPAWEQPWRGPDDELTGGDPARLLRVTKLEDARWEYEIRGARASIHGSEVSLAREAGRFFTPSALQVNEQAPNLLGVCAAHLGSVEACNRLDAVAKSVLNRIAGLPKGESKDHGNTAPADTEGDLQKATLATLLNETHADVAMLQEIDFWFQGPEARCLLEGFSYDPSHKDNPCIGPKEAESADSRRLQKILDIILWKGDSFVVIPVRGSVLQAVMKRSGDYNSADASGLSPEDDRGRGLVTLGLQHAGNDYLINDLPLDPNRLYSVVTTDYIGAGDTAYPEFNDLSVPASPRPFFAKRFKYISSALCERAPKIDGWTDQDCSTSVKSADYFDALVLLNPKPPRGDTRQHQFWLWFPFHRRPGQDRAPAKSGKTKPEQGPVAEADDDDERPVVHDGVGAPGPSAPTAPEPDPSSSVAASAAAMLLTPAVPKSKGPSAEQWAQDYPRWKLSLDKGSVGFTLQRHSDTQHDLNTTFGGVASSQALAPPSHNWLTDIQLTFLRSASTADFVFTPELSYAGAFTEAKQGGFRNPNQSVDALTLDTGLRFHILPQKRSSPWTIDTTYHFETQPFAIIQSLTLPSGSLPLQFPQPRTRMSLGRVGLGRYDRKSYLQVGAQAGGQSHAFRDFAFPGTAVPACFPSATETLQQCVNGSDGHLSPSSQVQVVQEFRYRTGLFWHSLLVFPAGQRVTASLENQGNFFFVNAGDNSTDTRLEHLMTAKISFPIWPMISVSPTYRFYYYENKLAYKSLWQQQALITIDYKFDWTNKRIAQSQLEYKNAQSGQK